MGSLHYFFQVFCKLEMKSWWRKNRPPKEKTSGENVLGLGNLRHFALINCFFCSLPEASLSKQPIERP